MIKISIEGDIDLTDDLAVFVSDLAEEMPKAFRQLTDESVPQGRIYRRGAIRGRYSRGLRRIAGTKTRAAIGSRFHRASAKGQFPAKDRGRLYRQIKVKGGKLKKHVVFNAPYAGYVEKIRPFTVLTVERAVLNVFNQI